MQTSQERTRICLHPRTKALCCCISSRDRSLMIVASASQALGLRTTASTVIASRLFRGTRRSVHSSSGRVLSNLWLADRRVDRNNKISECGTVALIQRRRSWGSFKAAKEEKRRDRRRGKKWDESGWNFTGHRKREKGFWESALSFGCNLGWPTSI